MTEKTLVKVAESINKKLIYKQSFGTQVAMIGQTQMAYDTIDENGNKYLETDFSKFPSTCTSKYILDCIEANCINLGKIRKMNYRYFKDKSFVIADIETTGFSTNMGAEILQIGALKIDEEGNEIDRFNRFVKPYNCKKIPKKIVELTGITDEDIKDADSPSVVMRDFLQFFKGSTIVFHNKMFDWDRFLIPYAAKYGFLIPELYPCLDTKILSKNLYPDEKKHDLETLCNRLEVEIKDHHNAFADVQMTAKIFIKMRNIYREKWELFPYITWSFTSPMQHNVVVKRVNRWDKWMPKKKVFSKLRFYVDFTVDGKYGKGYYDFITKEWIIQNTQVSFDGNQLEEAAFKYLQVNSYEEMEASIPSTNKPADI